MTTIFSVEGGLYIILYSYIIQIYNQTLECNPYISKYMYTLYIIQAKFMRKSTDEATKMLFFACFGCACI